MDYTPSPQEYLTQAFSVIPLRLGGSKRPVRLWTQYQKQKPTEDELDQWFPQSASSGIGVVTGEISGNLHVIDFDADAEEVFPRFWDDIQQKIPGIADRFLVVQTPRPGRQVWFRQDSPVDGNLVLARKSPRPLVGDTAGASGDSEVVKLQPPVMIETRGEGGYVVAPGSPVDVHPNSTPYKIIHGSLSSLAPVSMEESENVLNSAEVTVNSRPSMCSVSPAKSTQAFLAQVTFLIETLTCNSCWSITDGLSIRSAWMESSFDSSRQDHAFSRPGKIANNLQQRQSTSLEKIRILSSRCAPPQFRIPCVEISVQFFS